MKWTGTAVETMRAIAAGGGSFSDAAEQLGTSRCAVAGKAYREGITFACEPERRSKRLSVGKHRYWEEVQPAHRAHHVMAIGLGVKRWWGNLSPDERLARLAVMRSGRLAAR